MDSSQNWLAFSLSNHHSSSSSLFEAAFYTPRSGGVVDRAEEDATATDLNIFSASASAAAPKLEDFLGGCGGAGSAADACHFAGDAAALPPTDLYDSELKSLAASFLHGFAAAEPIADTRKHLAVVPAEQPVKKAVDTFGQRTSIYRGVTRHRWTGRYEAHLWDNSCRREGQSRKGRQVYLGGYDKEEKAARAYDLAALKYWGPTTTTNFPVSNYEKELEEMTNMTRQEFVASLRRKSSGFSRGASIYRGVTRHHQHGRWQARIGRVAGNKDLYLGTFSTQEEAAEAYDIAAIKFRGLNAVTNFDMSRYDVKSIISSNLPVGGANAKSKTSSDSTSDDRDLSSASSVTFSSQPPPPASSSLSFALPIKQGSTDYWSSILGYNSSSTSSNSSTLFQGLQSTTPFSVDYSAANINGTSAVNQGAENSGNGYFNNGYFLQQQSNGSMVPGFEGLGSGYGNWVNGPPSSSSSSSLHSFQSANKPNLSVFQTPIFGIE